MRRLALLLLISCVPVSATTRYVSQAGGSFSGGTNCNGQTAISVSTFNATANAGDDIDWLCGAITSQIAPSGNGTSGHPVLINFDTGASVKLAVCNPCISLVNKSYFTVDGKGVGIIGSTANGTGLANQSNSTGIDASGSTGVTIQNNTIQNIYVHTGTSNDGIDQTQMRCVYANSWTALTITGNTMHDAGWCINIQYGTGTSLTIQTNTIYNCDHGIAFGGSSNGTTTGTLLIDNNEIYGFANWDTAGDNFHHDAIHIYGNTTPTASTTVAPTISNNYMHGPWSTCSPSCATGGIFIESGSTSPGITGVLNVFNNVCTAGASDTISSGGGCIDISDGGSTNNIVNNTVRGGGANCALGFTLQNLTGANVQNNVVSNCNQLIWYKSDTFTTLDHNIYAQAASSNAFEFGVTFYSAAQYANYVTASGEGANSSYQASDGLSVSGTVNGGSPVINAGANLTSLSIARLDSDRLNSARPGVAAWTDGAYNAVAGGTFVTPVSAINP